MTPENLNLGKTNEPIASVIFLAQTYKMSRSLIFIFWMFSSIGVHAETVFYLHGKIVEDHGDKAIHPQYGVYDYESILAKLRQDGHTVYSERRQPNTDRAAYSRNIISEIKALLDSGIEPQEIVVIGFSKGAQIAILVSQSLANAEVRFVFQAVCGSWVRHYKDLKVHGDILSLFEVSDSAGSCDELFRRSSPSTCEISIETGLKHGAFYRPIDAWLKPQRKWIQDGTCLPD